MQQKVALHCLARITTQISIKSSETLVVSKGQYAVNNAWLMTKGKIEERQKLQKNKRQCHNNTTKIFLFGRKQQY